MNILIDILYAILGQELDTNVSSKTKMIRTDEKVEPSIMRQWLHMLLRDICLCAAIFLVALVLAAFLGSFLLDDIATKQNLRGRNALLLIFLNIGSFARRGPLAVPYWPELLWQHVHY